MLTPEQIDAQLELQKSKYGVELRPEEDSFAKAVHQSKEFDMFVREALVMSQDRPEIMFGFIATAMFVGYKLGKEEGSDGTKQPQQLN